MNNGKVEVHQWFKNGDHPDDGPATDEGRVVRYFRRPEPRYAGARVHPVCGQTWASHGWIDTMEDGYTVCPGDWIVTGTHGERFPCKGRPSDAGEGGEAPRLIISNVIHRAELAIDDRPHGIDLTGDILHAAVRRHGAVDVWYQARRDPAIKHMRRSFQIVATGQPFPAWLSRPQKTAITPDGQLVWHVLESYCPHQNVIHTGQLGDQLGYGTGICGDCHVTLEGDGPDRWIPA